MLKSPRPIRTLRLAAANRRGFTLVELLIVVAIMGIVTAMIVPRLEPTVASQLEAAAAIVVADLDYARHLAVTNQSSYSVEFSSSLQQYAIAHSGTNPRLDALPSSPFRRPGDPADQHIGRMADLPRAGPGVRLLAALTGASTTPVTRIEFGPLGELTSGASTTVWLTSGDGRMQYYLPIRIHPITGLSTQGSLTSADPLASSKSVVVESP